VMFPTWLQQRNEDLATSFPWKGFTTYVLPPVLTKIYAIGIEQEDFTAKSYLRYFV
jgi:hypothetical protein